MFLNIPKDTEEAKLELLSIDPCPTVEFFNPEVFIVTSDPELIHFFIWFHVPFILFHDLAHVFFHATCTVFYIFIVPSKNTTSNTRQIQRQFFIGMIFQTAIPVLLLAAPATYAILSFSIGTLDQAKMNIAFIIAGLHGIGESVAVLAVHKSYRNAIWKIALRLGRKQDTHYNNNYNSKIGVAVQ